MDGCGTDMTNEWRLEASLVAVSIILEMLSAFKIFLFLTNQEM